MGFIALGPAARARCISRLLRWNTTASTRGPAGCWSAAAAASDGAASARLGWPACDRPRWQRRAAAAAHARLGVLVARSVVLRWIGGRAMIGSPLALARRYFTSDPSAITTPVVATWAIMLLLAGGSWLLTRTAVAASLQPCRRRWSCWSQAIEAQIRDTMRAEPAPYRAADRHATSCSSSLPTGHPWCPASSRRRPISRPTPRSR